MAYTLNNLFLELLRSALCGTALPPHAREAATPEALPALYHLSRVQNMAHLVCHVLETNGLLPEGHPITQKFIKRKKASIFFQEQQIYTLDTAMQVLEKAGIPFIALKGAVLRGYYPEPWMRSSVDVDILVHHEDTDKALLVLTQQLPSTVRRSSAHDISLYTNEDTHIELHYHLVERDQIALEKDFLDAFWRHATPREGYSFCLDLSDEMFYLYHVLHAAKHFVGGGCGVKPLMDTWILRHGMPHDSAARHALLEEYGLLTFGLALEHLSEVWFGDATHTPLTKKMADFLFSGGAFGTVKSRVTIQRIRKGGGIRYIFTRAFQPFGIMKDRYPVLIKHPYLLPFCYIHRLVRGVLLGRGKSAVAEIKAVADVPEKETSAALDLLHELGL